MNYLPLEIENKIYEMSKQMLFSNVKKELDKVKRSINKVSDNYMICRGIITWELPNKKLLRLTNKQIYIFNFNFEID